MWPAWSASRSSLAGVGELRRRAVAGGRAAAVAFLLAAQGSGWDGAEQREAGEECGNPAPPASMSSAARYAASATAGGGGGGETLASAPLLSRVRDESRALAFFFPSGRVVRVARSCGGICSVNSCNWEGKEMYRFVFQVTAAGSRSHPAFFHCEGYGGGNKLR